MRRLAPALAFALALACKDKPAPPAPSTPAAAPFTLRDLALATALDARLARLSLVALDAQRAGRAAAGERAGAKQLVPQLRSAGAEVERAAGAIANPADRALASRVGALAGKYVEALAAALERSGAATAPVAAAEQPDVAGAQRALGEEIDAYRRSRAGWRLDPSGGDPGEREFEDARREVERMEGAFVSRRAPVEPEAVERAARRASAAARGLAPALGGPAGRYAAAQTIVLSQLTELSAASLARDAARASAAGRGYQAAKAEALAALADYFAALAAR